MELEEFLRLKRKLEKLRSDKDRVKGALQSVMKKIKEELHCSSLEELKDKIEREKEALKEDEAKFQKLMSKFQKKWGGKL
jgi:phage shock protein A